MTKIAANGEHVDISTFPKPTFPERGVHQLSRDFAERMRIIQRPDHFDLSMVNENLLYSIYLLAEVNQHLSVAKQDYLNAQTTYASSFNRAIHSVSGGTEKSRVATAEIMAENELVARRSAEAQYEELKSLSYTISKSIEALTVIANNIRADLKIGIQ